MSFRRSLKYDPWQLQVLLKAACELFDFFFETDLQSEHVQDEYM